MRLHFLYEFLAETFLILNRIQLDIITNARRALCKVPVIGRV
jgi:hypothetical protein